MRETVPLLVTIGLALLLASVVILVVPKEGAKAAFPGINGKIVFQRDPDGYQGPKDLEIFTIRFDGTNLQRLTNNTTRDMGPSWSADGRKIVFTRRGEIYTMNADGSHETRLNDERKVYGYSPSFSPSGRQIVFVRFGQDGYYHLYRIRADGTNPTKLVDTSHPEDSLCCPSWSPGGSKIAYTHSDYYDSYIRTVKPDGSGGRTLGYGSSPNWSPDGSQIVFVKYAEIYKMNADGTGEVPLTTNQAGDFSPAFSPGGGKIVFASDRDGDADLYIMDADGSDVSRQLVHNGGTNGEPDWRPVQ